MLRRNGRRDVRVFVVWEPILETDWARPGPSITANVPDGRASHFWDVNHRLSAMYGGTANIPNLAADRNVKFKMNDIIWDTALVYPPGKRWGDPAASLDAPVYKSPDLLP